MASGQRHLLVVLPGSASRAPALHRLVDAFDFVAVLVHRKNDIRSNGPMPRVSEWIEFGCSDGDNDPTGEQTQQLAMQAVSEWCDTSGAEVSGCMALDEWGIEICAYLCDPKNLNLPCTPLETVLLARDKCSFRQVCAAAGLPAVRHMRVQSRAELASALRDGPCWRYPLILKPARGAGSCAVRKVHSERELLAEMAVLDRALGQAPLPCSDAAGAWVCEEFFAGCEVDVDGWACDGRVEFMLASDNKPCKEGSCCETGGIYPSQLPPELVTKLENLTRAVVAALPGLHTVFHFEALVNRESGEVMPIEMNLRVGGCECPESVAAISGHYLPLVAADLALGQPVRPPSQPTAAVVATTNVHLDVPGIIKVLEESKDLNRDADLLDGVIHGSAGRPYVPGQGSLSCLAWYAAKGPSASEAQENLQRLLSKLIIEIEPIAETHGDKKDHYKHVAEIYNTNLFYDLDGPLVQWQRGMFAKHLQLGEHDVLADIGGGTGAFTGLLGRPEQLWLVEPSKEMLAQAPAGMRTMHADALGFAAAGERVDRILMKEVLHHCEGNLDEVLGALRGTLREGGRMLIMTRPHEPEYPFFDLAMDAWKESQSPYQLYVEALESAGFSVTVTVERFPLRVKTETWCNMMRTRWWSCFTSMAEEELEAGIRELREKRDEYIDFHEVEIYMVAEPRGDVHQGAGGLSRCSMQ